VCTVQCTASGQRNQLGDFQKNEDFSFSEYNLNIKCYERKVNILKQAQRTCMWKQNNLAENICFDKTLIYKFS
jgi:hypothetical protein